MYTTENYLFSIISFFLSSKKTFDQKNIFCLVILWIKNILVVLLKRRILILFSFLYLGDISVGLAQGGGGSASAPQTLPQPIPPSPTAASLGRYGEIPIGKYTGVPDVSIPIWKVINGDIELPISLSYHASGVRVEDIASQVGLGWSLNAGGVITRTVKGKPDENGYQSAPIPNQLINPQASPSYCDVWSAALYVYLVGSKTYGYDSEPDTYYFNFNGVSGKFVFDQNGVPYTIPYQNIKIERQSETEWKITTPDGFIYKFGGAATERTDVYNVNYEYYGESANKSKTLSYSSLPSSWFLYEIDSPNGRIITFEYSNEDYETTSGISQQVKFNTTATSTANFIPSNTGSVTRFYAKKLNKISFPNGVVKFISAAERRKDLALNGLDPNAYPLEKIAICDVNDQPIKVFKLTTSYFQSDDQTQTYNTQRLRLNALTELTGNEQLAAKPYIFSYEDTYKLPSRMSSSQDHWGYFNGKQNLDYRGYPILIPSQLNNYFLAVAIQQSGGAPQGYSISPGPIRCPDMNASGCNILVPNIRTFQFNGADRSANFNYTKTAILTQVKYPTGGFTNFEYEPNDYNLQNYKYVENGNGITAFATCCDPLNNPVVRSGNQYMVTKTINPNQFISSDLRAKNQSVPFTLQFSANLDGYDNKCCKGCSTPYGYFKDVTTNTLLIEISGLVNTQTIGNATIDQSIQGQFSSGGTALLTKTGNTINISGLLLDPSHTYELFSRAATCPGESCQEFPNCPAVTRNMELYSSASFSYQTNTVEKYNGDIGGLRISKISSFAADGDQKPIIRKYLYRLSSDPLGRISSGVVIDLPQYFDLRSITNFYMMFKYYSGAFGLGANYSIPIIKVANTSDQYVLTSGSKFELGQTSGSFVGYSEVQEYLCPDNNCGLLPVGKKVYTYTSPADYMDSNSGVFGRSTMNGSYDINSPCPAPNSPYFSLTSTLPASVNNLDNIYPFPQKVSFDWKRGLLLTETTYDSNNVKKQLIENTYNLIDDPQNRKVIPAVKIILGPDSDPNSFGQNFYFGKYEIIAAWNYQKSQKITDFSDNGATSVVTKNFYYDNPTHAQITRTELISSKGEVIQTKNKYVGDEASISGLSASESDAITKLKSKFRFASLLETEISRNGSLISTARTGYKDWANNIVAPENNYSKIGSGTLESRIKFLGYDELGNLQNASSTDGSPTCWIYGYGGSLPIAKIQNASYSSVIAALGGQTNVENFRNFTIRTDAQVKDFLAPLRNIPNALVTTYTYDPLVGMTSITDAKGMTTYFEYDGFQRLINVKDQNKNIIKHTDYHYQGQ